MDLTAAQYALINSGMRQRGYRLKAKKPSGIHIPGITTIFPATEILMDGTGDYAAPNTTGENYIALIRDTYKHRNRTFVLHYNQFSENNNAVISVIDHKENVIYTLNKNTISGDWPATYNDYPDNWLYDAKTNFLYVSVPAIAAANPLVMKIDMSMEVSPEVLDTCKAIEQKPVDQLWACTLLEAPAGLTRNNDGLGPAAYPTAPRCHYKIIALHNNKLYCWYQNNYTSADFHASNFGYFDSAGGYSTLWTLNPANIITETYADPRICAHPDGNCASTDLATFSGNVIPGISNVAAYYYNSETKNVTLAFAPTFPSTRPSYGNEAFILEFNLDLIIDHTDGNFTTEMLGPYTANTSTVTISPTEYAYYPTGHAGCPSTNIDTKIDCQFAAWPDNQQLVEVYIEWEYTAKAAARNYWIHIETAIQAPASGVDNVVYADVTTGSYAALVMIDPADPFIRITAYSATGTVAPGYDSSLTTLNISAHVRPCPFGTQATASVMSAAPLVQVTDAYRPETEDFDPGIAPDYVDETNMLLYGRLQVQKVVDSAPYQYTVPVAIIENGDFFYVAIDTDAAGTGAGLWQINKNGLGIYRITAANSTLEYDDIDWIYPVDETGHSNSFLIASSPYSLTATRNYVQYFDVSTDELSWGGDTFDSGVVGLYGHLYGVAYGADWIVYCTYKVIHVEKPGYSTSTQERWLRNWWDGTNPDIIIEGDDPITLDETGRVAGVTGMTFSNSKGEASYDLNFAVGDVDYLPWVDSVFNENPAAPGTYGGVLEDGTRLIMQRGIYGDNGEWVWIDECQVFIISEPARAAAGIARMNVNCKGVIGMFITRSIYEWIHRPDEQIYTDVTFITTDDLIYYYEVTGDRIVDWKTSPAPIVKVNGVVAYNYTLHTSAGEIEFYTAQTGKTITATFTAFVPGTNEAEDIIICILRHPNEVGGCGLDDTYFTANILNETLSTTDHLTYSFSKNNIRNPDGYNKIYQDGVEITVGFTWDYRDGTVTFAVSPIGTLITGDCTYFTIQKSGITLREIAFTPKEQRTAYDCINEVVRRVAPNYIFHEMPNGKLECDYYTQKPDGSEDLEIVDDNIVLRSLADNPMYYSLATYIISFGQAPLSELPNLCLGKTVTNEWPYAWHVGADMQTVVDGDPATQITAGYGRWSGDGTTKAVQDVLIATGETGMPMISIDLGASKQVETIIIARGSQVATEGDAGAMVIFSLWASEDELSWEKLVDPFTLPPGQNNQFKAGTNYDEHTTFRYIRVNCHSLGLYNWKGHTNSQLGISEVQCYESEILTGIAKLQDEDSTADYFDQWGLLKKYGRHLVYIARGGSPDSALYTQDKVDADAGFILDEMMRLMSQVEIESPYLPGARLYDTIKIRNGALQKTVTMFVESRTVSETGDVIKGTNLP